MRYVIAKAEQKAMDKAYRIYVTDGIKVISENTAKFVSNGSYLGKRFIDAIKKAPVETRTSDEIISDIRDKLRKLG